MKGSGYFWTGAKCICRMGGDVDTLAIEAGQAIHHQASPERGLSETSQGLKLEPASVGKFLCSNLCTESQCSRDTGWGILLAHTHMTVSHLEEDIKDKSLNAVPINVGDDAHNFTDRMVLSLLLQIALLEKK